MKDCYIGVMSGTSLDGVDVAIVRFPADTGVEILAAETLPIPTDLASDVLDIVTQQKNCDLQTLGSLDQRFGQLYADAVNKVLLSSQIERTDITAIGSHGQTLFHAPTAPHPFTLQIGDANRIAELTGITTVADFRRRDMACGGQGAPLAPSFHAARFSSAKENRVVLNIGGISNITVLASSHGVLGYDTGPGNSLLDAWHQQHNGGSYDLDGKWAAGGRVNIDLMERLLNDDYFEQLPPKSTGKEYFNLGWLTGHLLSMPNAPDPQDVQSTLAELTAQTIADSIKQHGANCRRCIVCGGGALNMDLMARLQRHLPTMALVTSDEFGIAPDMVEAVAFAWLAKCTLANVPGNIPSVTGANKAVVLGAIYPAG